LKKTIAIAIDGPAAAGKSTVAKIVAEKLSYIYIDTGAMYRALTLKAIENNVDINAEDELSNLLDHITIDLEQNKTGQLVLINGENVTKDIRNINVTNKVSYVAQHPKIRQEMVKRQQNLAKSGGVVMDGRDIGTHVLPKAELKIFLIASVEERAKRRYKENSKKGFQISYEQLKKEIRNRDLMDSQRKISPLTKAEDAIELDTTSLTISDVVEKILARANSIIQE